MKKVWNKFLELKTSPTFMFVALIGLVDLCIWLPFGLLITIFEDVLSRDIWFLSMIIIFIHGECRPIIYKYSFIVIPVLYFIEFMFKIKIENNLTENSKKYNIIWLFGIIAFIIDTIVRSLLYCFE